MSAMLAGAPLGYAQTSRVSGKVTDDLGPVPSVAVYVKGAPGTGTTTDLDGNYSIEASAEQVLVFSCMGYSTSEVPVQGRSVVNVVLSNDTEMLEELVVIGYGVQKKSLLTGSISSVKGDKLD